MKGDNVGLRMRGVVESGSGGGHERRLTRFACEWVTVEKVDISTSAGPDLHFLSSHRDNPSVRR